MLRLLLSRLWQAALVLLAVTFVTFALLAGAGGDALVAAGHDPAMSAATEATLRRIYELDQPLPVRYARWLAGIVRGDLGFSFYFHAPVASILPRRLLRTFALGITALVIAWALGLTFGVLAAGGTKWSRRLDYVCRPVTTLLFATPRLVLALVALTLLATLGGAAGEARTANRFPSDNVESLARFTLAAVALAMPLVALFLTHARESFAAALNEEFVRVARAKGLPERVVVMRHAARAALNPLITLFGLSLGGVLSGSVVVESVLGWNGVGQLSVLAVRSRDIGLLLSIVLVTTAAVLAGNLLSDVLLRLNDPQLRAREGSAE